MDARFSLEAEGGGCWGVCGLRKPIIYMKIFKVVLVLRDFKIRFLVLVYSQAKTCDEKKKENLNILIRIRS